MSRVAVITDTSACIPRDVIEQYGIHVLPLLLIFEDRSYRDGIDIDASRFYELLRKAKRLPTSSSPSPGEYLDAFREIGKTTDSILCITLPPHLGMAHESAVRGKELAAHEVPDVTIEILPSRGPALAQGFIAQGAARAAACGKDLSQVVDAARDMMQRVNALALLDTLYYLAKGGRIPKAAAWAGFLLNIKPILDATDDVRLLERCRTRKRGLQRLLEIMQERVDGKAVCVNLMHANVPEDADRLKAAIVSQFACSEFYITDFTPVLGAHTGPGSVAISFYTQDSTGSPPDDA